MGCLWIIKSDLNVAQFKYMGPHLNENLSHNKVISQWFDAIATISLLVNMQLLVQLLLSQNKTFYVETVLYINFSTLV